MKRAGMRTAILAFGFTAAGFLVAVAYQASVGQANAQPAGVAQPAPAAPLRHVVLFKFKPDATEQQIQEIVTGFQALPKKIDGITAFEWGTNNSPEGLADGFTHCFVVSFKDAPARDAYLPHQAHKDFVAILRPRLEKVLVVDYFAKQ